jgi:hypothetical protein
VSSQTQTGWPELPPGIASWLVQVVRFIILMAQAVPISLYVSLETVKVAQCKVRRFTHLGYDCVSCFIIIIIIIIMAQAVLISLFVSSETVKVAQ